MRAPKKFLFAENPSQDFWAILEDVTMFQLHGSRLKLRATLVQAKRTGRKRGDVIYVDGRLGSPESRTNFRAYNSLDTLYAGELGILL